MGMKKFAAQYIFPVTQPPLKRGIVVINNDNQIVDLIDTGGDLREIAGLEFYNGVIVPGFVNTHCHLELSHLLGKFTPQNGMDGFINEIIQSRGQYDDEKIQSAIKREDLFMQRQGIVAVGDISNNNSTFATKQQSPIDYHTFIEISGPSNAMAKTNFSRAAQLATQISQFNLQHSIVPHASYSVGSKLFKLIKREAEAKHSILSFHNQESVAEEEFFTHQKGKLLELFNQLNFTIVGTMNDSTKNSLQTVAHLLPKSNRILLIHNITTNEQDIDFAENYFDEVYWALCPNSNLFIENTLPNAELFAQKKVKVTLGTDSLASNQRLSILNEMKTLQANFPSISFQTLLEWATINGAKALNLDGKLGSIEKGKKSGLVLINNFDFQAMKLTANSNAKVLM